MAHFFCVDTQCSQIPHHSLTEYPSYWGEHPELFAACAQGKDDVEQMVNVLKWFIGTLKGQYMSRSTSMGSEKKVRIPADPDLKAIAYSPIMEHSR